MDGIFFPFSFGDLMFQVSWLNELLLCSVFRIHTLSRLFFLFFFVFFFFGFVVESFWEFLSHYKFNFIFKITKNWRKYSNF
jgi:hypothetical protein